MMRVFRRGAHHVQCACRVVFNGAPNWRYHRSREMQLVERFSKQNLAACLFRTRLLAFRCLFRTPRLRSGRLRRVQFRLKTNSQLPRLASRSPTGMKLKSSNSLMSEVFQSAELVNPLVDVSDPDALLRRGVSVPDAPIAFGALNFPRDVEIPVPRGAASRDVFGLSRGSPLFLPMAFPRVAGVPPLRVMMRVSHLSFRVGLVIRRLAWW